MIWCHMIFWLTTHLMPYWGIFSFRLRFLDLHWFAWSSPVTRYTLSWWFDFILSWFFGGAFLESFRQAHTFWCCHDSWMELSLVHRLPYHHFSGVHVRSLIHPHWVILELSGQTGCSSCYTGAYFSLLVVEMIVFSQTYYSLHYWDEVYFFALLVIVSVIGRDEPLEEHDVLGFDCPAIHDSSVDWDRGSYPSELFSWDSPLDHSFEMTMDSSNGAFRVRGVWLVVTLHQALWFS